MCYLSKVVSLVPASKASFTIMTSWQTKIQYNVWRPSTAIQLGDSDGNRRTVGDPATETLRLFFRTDRVNFSVIGVASNRDYTRFSDAANDVVDARIYMGIHFRFADVAGRSSGQRVGRWVYRYFLRSHDDSDEFEFMRSLDALDELEAVEENVDGQDDDDAEGPEDR